MFDLDKWHEIFSTLRHNKLRTAMTACGVFWGVFMLVMMLGFGTGLERGVSKNMIGFVTNSVYMWGQRTSMAYKGLQPGRRVRFSNSDIEALRRGLDGLSALAPRIQLGGWREGNNVAYGSKTGNFGVMGDYPELGVIESIRPTAGRFINELDMRQRRKVVVIGDQVRRVLFEDEQEPIGKYLKIRGVHFQVIGVYASARPGEQGERANGTLHVPFTTFQTTFNAMNQVGWFAVEAKPDISAADVEQRARDLLKAQHGVHPEDDRAIGSFNAAETFNRVDSLFVGVRFFIWFVSIATLFAGALGVSNIMLISVKERTKEIGVRKALGATPASVISLVIQESALLTGLSGYCGLVVGVLTLELAESTLARGNGPLGAPSIDLTAALVATLVVAVTGVIAGIAPARHAARIQPVEALRSE